MAMILLGIGFPIALILAWAYIAVTESSPMEIPENHDGILAGEEGEQIPGRKRFEFSWKVIAFVVIFGFAGLFIWHLRSNRIQAAVVLPESVREMKVGVAVFNNFTGDESLDALGEMASEWIASGLRELGVRTSSPEMMRRYRENVGILPGNPIGDISFKELTGAQSVITGSYYKKGDSIQLVSRLESTETGNIIFDFPVIWGQTSQKEKLIGELGEKFRGYWAISRSNKTSLVTPPKYATYQAFLKCCMFDYHGWKKVLELDSTFILARIYLAYPALSYEDEELYLNCVNYRTVVLYCLLLFDRTS